MPHRFTASTPTSLSGRVVVEFFVADWEIECCAPPPAVGEPTTWRLVLVPAAGLADDVPARRGTWLVEPRGTWTALTDGPVVACWPPSAEAPPPPGRHPLRGLLVGTRHGGTVPDDLPKTTGRVDRVRLASQLFRLDGERTLHPVAGTLELVDVPRSPRRFRNDPLPRPGAQSRQQTGVLVAITVPG